MNLRILALLLLAGCITGQTVLPQESGRVSAFFCDRIDCEEVFLNLTKGSSSLDCAIYHPSDAFAARVLQSGSLVVDGEHDVPGATVETGSGLMHNKFCIINESVVWTGSWNPAQGMTIANNVVVLESKTLARAFSNEFDELEEKTFQKGKKGPAAVLLNGNKTESYFCPEDECTRHILDILRNAESSIHALTFSFTDDEIGKLLEEKTKSGLDVRVVFDPRKDDRSSEYARLKEYSKIAKLHHKVFIIDGRAVITGSMNPTRNGDEGNDENVIVLREANVASAFEEEFERFWIT